MRRGSHILWVLALALGVMPQALALSLPKVPLHQWVARDAALSFSMSLTSLPGPGTVAPFVLSSRDGKQLKGSILGAMGPAKSASLLVVDLAQSGPQNHDQPHFAPDHLLQTLGSRGYFVVVLERDPLYKDALDEGGQNSQVSQGDLVASLKSRVTLRILLVDWLEKQVPLKSPKPIWVSVDPQGFGVFQAARDPRIQQLVWINLYRGTGYPESFWSSSFDFELKDLTQGLGKRPLKVLQAGPSEAQSPSWILPHQLGPREIWSIDANGGPEEVASSYPQIPELICTVLALGNCPQLTGTMDKVFQVLPRPGFHKTKGSSLWHLLAPESSVTPQLPNTLSPGGKILLINSPDDTLAQAIGVAASQQEWQVVYTFPKAEMLPHQIGFSSCCLIHQREFFLKNARDLRGISEGIQKKFFPKELAVIGTGIGSGPAMLAALDNQSINSLLLFSPSVWFERLLRKNPELFGEKHKWTESSSSRLRQELWWVDPFHLLAQINPPKWRLYGGTKDRMTPPDVVHSLGKRVGIETRFFPVDQKGNEELFKVLVEDLEKLANQGN